jgi:hypothetical protein
MGLFSCMDQPDFSFCSLFLVGWVGGWLGDRSNASHLLNVVPEICSRVF